MFHLIPNIVKKTFTYGVFNGISALFPFFLLPILTRYLNTEEYGIITLINVIIIFMGVILRLELQAALKREYVENKEDFHLDVGTILSVPLINFVFLLIIVVTVAPQMAKICGFPQQWFLGMLVIALGTALSSFLSALYQIKDKAFSAGMWGLINTAPVFLGAFVLIVFYGLGWQGRIWPMVFTSIFIQIPLSFYLIGRLVPHKLEFEIHRTIDLLKYSIPLVPMTVATYIMQVGDRVFITNMVGLEAAGLYAVSAQLATIMAIAYNSFMPTWEVFVLRKLNENSKNNLDQLKLYFAFYIAGMIVLALFVIFVFPYIMPYILGKSFLGSMKYLTWLIAGVTASGIYYALYPFIYYLKKTKVLMYVNFFLVGLFLILNYILISLSGAIGAAQSILFVYIVGFCILSYIIQKYCKFPLTVKEQVSDKA